MKRMMQITAALGVVVFCNFGMPMLGRAAPAPGDIVTAGAFEHGVTDIVRTVAFYRALGLEGGPSRPPPLPPVPDLTVLEYMDIVGSELRVTVMRVPGSKLAMELAEVTAIDRKPAGRRVQDPGAEILMLTVRNLDTALSAATAGGATVVTAGGKPIAIGEKDRAVLVRDPDGLFVLLRQPGAIPAAEGTPAGNVIGGQFAIAVNSVDRSMRLYRDVLGFQPRSALWASDRKTATLFGLPNAKLKIVESEVPTTSNIMAFIEFQNAGRRSYVTRLQDSGTALLHLTVRDMDSMVGKIKATGAPVLAKTGKPVLDGDKRLVTILRDANNFHIDLWQLPPKP